jgi:transcription elongation factor GreA
MDQAKVYLTKEGLENLKKEYQSLTEVRRPSAVERLANARSAGDLSENSDYTQAKEDLSYIDGRIAELEEVLARVVLIDEDGHKGCQQVKLGCKVTVQANGEKHIFHVVGEWEADPQSKKISHESPLGKALLGKAVGELVEVEAPAGKIAYKILGIE